MRPWSGPAGRGSLVSMSLRDKNGTLKAKSQATSSPLFGAASLFFGEWRKQLYPVNVRTGDKVIGTYAADATMIVPSVSAIPNAATDHVHGHCFNNAFFEVAARHNDGSDSAYAYGKTAANGNFNIDVTKNYPTYNLRANDEILLVCALFPYQLQFDVPAEGFGVRREPTLGRRVLREGGAQRGARHTTDTDQQEHAIPARVPPRRSSGV